MVPRNMSLTPQDEEALRLLAGRIQLYHTFMLGHPPEGFSVSWAIRALIRFADQETSSWRYQDSSQLLERLVEHGVRDPREEPAKLPPAVKFTEIPPLLGEDHQGLGLPFCEITKNSLTPDSTGLSQPSTNPT